MTEDVSITMMISIIMLMAAGLLSVTLTIAVPSMKFLFEQVNNYDRIASISYRQLQGMNGQEYDAGRIYRYIMETEDKIGCVAVRENPETSPSNYKILMCVERTAVTPALQQHMNTWFSTNPDLHYQEYNTYFGHDMIEKDFRIYVETFPDGGLEIICDLTDEFYD